MKKILFISLCFLLCSCNNNQAQSIQDAKDVKQKEFKITTTSLSGPHVEVIQHPSEGTLFMIDKVMGRVFYYIPCSDSIIGHWEFINSYHGFSEYPYPNKYQLVFTEGLEEVLIMDYGQYENEYKVKEPSKTSIILKKDSIGRWSAAHAVFADEISMSEGKAFEGLKYIPYEKRF